MLNDLLRNQRQKLIKELQENLERPNYIDPSLITTLALLDILELLQVMAKDLDSINQHP